MMTEANITRLVSKLSQMRGAALKLGQFMSIQGAHWSFFIFYPLLIWALDTHLLPPEVDKIFRRVQDSAHYMPDWQMQQVLCTSLGETWADKFTSFDRIPFAAASIGQVHQAVLAPSQSPSGEDGKRVAVKIQFPNIANSIASDLGYVKMVLTAGSLLPRGLFLDRTIQVCLLHISHA
jgi:aarF domain-containing kinase